MTQHLHSTHVPGCFRCDLSADEVQNIWEAPEPDPLAAHIEALEAELADARIDNEALHRVEMLARWYESHPKWKSWGIHNQIRMAIRGDIGGPPR